MKAVILAGGGGKRLWPLSTTKNPKQFQKLVSDKTMIEDTISRLDFLKNEDIYIATNKEHLPHIKKLCPQIPKKNVLIEPALRDTAPCIGLAAAVIEKRHPGEVMAVIYADHIIKNKSEFQKKLKKAEKIARKENTLNIVEVKATEPNTNYGYVKLGKKIDTDTYVLDSFKEKPSQLTAKKFLKSGKYLWNTGIYVWKAATLLEKFALYSAKDYEKLKQIAHDFDNKKATHTLQTLYPTLTKISIDYAVMEKTAPKEVRIIKADNLGWSDIGKWDSVWEQLAKNPQANVLRGNIKTLDTEGTLIHSTSKKTIIALGLKNLIVVETENGLLISTKKDSKRIKEILD